MKNKRNNITIIVVTRETAELARNLTKLKTYLNPSRSPRNSFAEVLPLSFPFSLESNKHRSYQKLTTSTRCYDHSLRPFPYSSLYIFSISIFSFLFFFLNTLLFTNHCLISISVSHCLVLPFLFSFFNESLRY